MKPRSMRTGTGLVRKVASNMCLRFLEQVKRRGSTQTRKPYSYSRIGGDVNALTRYCLSVCSKFMPSNFAMTPSREFYYARNRPTGGAIALIMDGHAG